MGRGIAVRLSAYAPRMDVWTRLRSLPAIEDSPEARAAVLVALYEDQRGGVRVVLTKRPDDMRTHPGDVVFPGGRAEDGEGPLDTAIREAWEEVRLPPEAVTEVLGILTPVTTRWRERLIVPVVVRIERPERLVADPMEVEVIIEPTLDDLMDESRWSTSDYDGYTLWFFEFEEGTLWGATAFMVRELIGHLRGEDG
jgi:8-oxo-dGTP pyrophosphatase MutT (NUDIX family)